MLALGAVALANGLPPGGTFIDDDGNVHEGNIEAIAAAGITRGCNPAEGNTKYCPSSDLNRGQMAAFLRRAFEYPTSTVDFFIDDDGSTFEADINAIAQVGVTQGCNPAGGNTRYCPDELVRRDQMASFFARALDLPPIQPPPPIDPPPMGGELEVVFVAVRQGDAAIYQGACGDVGVIDVNRFRAGDVLTALDTYASRDLKWIASSGYDADHLGGIVDLATTAGVSVGTFFDRGGDRTVKDTATYRTYYDYVTGLRDRAPVDIGDTFTLCTGADQVTFTVISQGTDGTAIGGIPVTEENDRGLCLHVEYGDFDLATCGDINGTDAGGRTNIETPAAAAIGDVEVVNINHHGSSYSSNQTWVNTLDAEVAVVSVGENGFGHPSSTVMARWQASGALTFQTNSTTVSTGLVDGDIQIVTNGATTFMYAASASGRSGSMPLAP